MIVYKKALAQCLAQGEYTINYLLVAAAIAAESAL
jgi:hypothetical protein